MKSACNAVLLALALSASVHGQTGTKPVRYTWIASSCTTWNCAAAALVLADGEPNVLVLPTTVTDHPWIVLRRVEEGSVYVPEEEPFVCEIFENVTLASSRFTAMDGCHTPLILNVPDGRALVASLRECPGGKRRAAR